MIEVPSAVFMADKIRASSISSTHNDLVQYTLRLIAATTKLATGS